MEKNNTVQQGKKCLVSNANNIEAVLRLARVRFHSAERDDHVTVEDFIQQARANQFDRILLAFYREGLLGSRHGAGERPDPHTLSFSNPRTGERLTITGVRLFSLNRLEVQGKVVLVDKNGDNQLLSIPAQLLSWIKASNQHIEAGYWRQFESELTNSADNEAVMLAYRYYWQKHLHAAIRAHRCSSLWQYCQQNMTQDQQNIFFEQWGAVGHRYHPGSKTKMGFSLHENFLYSPEFQNPVSLVIAAIHKDISHTESTSQSSPYQQLIRRCFSTSYEQFCQALVARNLDPDDYYLIPIHPWQAAYTIPCKFRHLLERKQLIMLPECTYATHASMSMRTMLSSLDNPRQLTPNIKLPMAVHATSVMRTVSPESVSTGPRISNLLLQILDREPHIAGAMRILVDLAGIHVTEAGERDDLRHLAAILRMNAEYELASGETVVPVASLFVKTPAQKPLICEVLEALDCHSEKEIIGYFADYTKIVLKACLDLYLLYGIALEAHQQNTLVVFHNNRPQRLLMRDLGGLRLHLPSLAAAGLSLPPDTLSQTFTNSRLLTRRKFIHACLQSNLGELILHLSLYYQINEQVFWNVVKKEIDERFEALACRLETGQCHREYDAIVRDDWSMKALTRMRLNDKLDCDKDDMQGDIYIRLGNPFQSCHQAAIGSG